jgi:hypothetical protein
MRTVTILASLLILGGCASLTRSRVGPQVLAAYPYASDVSIQVPTAPSPVKRRLVRFVKGLVQHAARRRLRSAMDYRPATLTDVLSTSLPGAAPQIR